MRVLQVASEAFGLCKTGGLADVVTGLTRALVGGGLDVRLLLPAYRGAAAASAAKPILSLGDPLGTGPVRLLEGRLRGTDLRLWLVECDALYDRGGGPYQAPGGAEFPDNELRFGLLCRVAAHIAAFGAATGWQPDIVHCHDWQAGLVPAYLYNFGARQPRTLFTIHNLSFTGSFDPGRLGAVGLRPATFSMLGVELFGRLSFLKAGLYYADHLTTVSPTYAREIQTPEGGAGLHGLLWGRRSQLVGILNAIDERVWNPATDAHLPACYNIADLAGKAVVKARMLEELGVPAGEGPVFGWVGRLSYQKGVDLMMSALPRMFEAGIRVVVVGSGDAELEAALRHLARANPARFAFFCGYDEALSHRVIAGSDALLIPSRFEPCGLTQMYAMRYGTLPLVRRTGGLADTVRDADADPRGCGFRFDAPTSSALADAAIRVVAALEQPKRLAEIQARAMALPVGWRAPAAAYRDLYEQLMRQPPR